MVSILYVARTWDRWNPTRPASPDQAIALGLEALGCKVVRATERDNPKHLPKCDYLLYPKLISYPEWIWHHCPKTIVYYGDYRPPGHSDYDPISRADHIFCNFDDDRGIWIPYPIWCDDFDPFKERNDKWLWTGQKASYGGPDLKAIRDGDVDVLPPDTVRYGWNKQSPFLAGQDYIDAIQTHGYGLSVSHDNRIYRHSSDRLGSYLAGGITVAVRWFPAVEEFIAPGVFVYKERSELEDFVSAPTKQDPAVNHEFAREFWDGRVAAKTILEDL